MSYYDNETRTCLHPMTFRVDSQGVTEVDTPESLMDEVMAPLKVVTLSYLLLLLPKP